MNLLCDNSSGCAFCGCKLLYGAVHFLFDMIFAEIPPMKN